MHLKRCEAILLLALSSLSYGCWASLGLAAEPPLASAADSLSDRTADRLSAVEPSVVRGPALGALAPMQVPIGETDGGEPHGDILRPVPPMAFDATLAPAGNLGPAGMLSANQSHMLSPTETVDEASASVRSPQQGVMTLDRRYRDAMPGGPPPDHPQH
jgi:hypothetical protein